MLNIRNYQDIDFSGVQMLMNRSNEFDSFSWPLLREKLYGDPDWNPSRTWIAELDDQIVGFMLGVTRNIRGTNYGYIKLMGVEPSVRRKKIATQLFSTLESQFIQEGMNIFRIYDVPLNYYMPGIDPRYTPAICFAQKMGFTHFGDSVNMQVDLNDRDWEVSPQLEQLKKEDISIYRATVEDKPELFGFISTEWALWQNELEMAYRSKPVSIHIARYKGKIKAFSAYDGNNQGTGWFGPMGTHPDLRGKGIGTLLLYLCLNDIIKQGLKTATIPWVAPISFYSHYANAKIDRVFWRFEKKLTNV
ncbi:MAG TPA: hypothetical protein DEQ03_14920 [Marinilabiliales bacterium]|nr:hypothetical protein [Marinilabiliales bacterium]